MVRAIQIGLGNWGFSWARDVVPTVEAVQPVAYVDAHPDALKRVQNELGVAPELCFSSLEDAAKTVEADLVIATLRTDAHFPVVGKALDMGYHVIVEKPFTETMAQARHLVAKAETADRLLMVSQNYRYNPAPLAVAEVIASGALGAIDMVTIDFRKHAPSINYLYWEMPNPLLADMAIHHFDLMRMVLGDEPLRISCRSWNTPSSRFVHDPIAVATIEFRKGTLVSYRGSWMSSGADTPWSGEWAIDCAEGEIFFSSRDHKPSGKFPDIARIRSLKGEVSDIGLPELSLLDRAGTLGAIASAIETEVPPLHFSSGADNVMSLALVSASIASAAQGGAWVDIADILDRPDA